MLGFLQIPLLLLSTVFLSSSSMAQESPAAEPALDRMLGSMLMVGFRGSILAPDDKFLKLVADGRIGNVILFDRDVSTGGKRNIISPEQLRTLLRTLSDKAPGKMLVAVDQEGGQVRRLKPQNGFIDVPAAQRMGQENASATFEQAERLGLELKSLGINMDLAPVADVDSNPFNPVIGRLGRAFSSDPQKVAEHALAFGRGLAKSGVIPTLKHFPGQGCANTDTHLGLSDITQCFKPDIDLLPYAEIFRAGWPGIVMMGHVKNTVIDSNYPATLSMTMVTDLLRNGLGWQGVVMTDDLQMKAVSGQYDLKTSILLAIEAGNDILLFGNNLEWDENLPDKIWNALQSLIDEGKIGSERIRQSWLRINALHEAYKGDNAHD